MTIVGCNFHNLYLNFHLIIATLFCVNLISKCQLDQSLLKITNNRTQKSGTYIFKGSSATIPGVNIICKEIIQSTNNQCCHCTPSICCKSQQNRRKNQFYCIFNLSSNSCNKQILQSDKKVSDQHGGIKCTGQFQQLQSDQWSSISHFRFPLIISYTLQIFIFYSKLKCGQIEVEWQHLNRQFQSVFHLSWVTVFVIRHLSP